MATEIYIKEVQHSPLNGVEADAVIKEGDFVDVHGDGTVTVADPSNNGLPDGIVPHRLRGPQIREHEQDYSPVQYEVGEGPVPLYPLEEESMLTQQALTAGEAVGHFEEVAFDANTQVVPSSSADAVTDPMGIALQSAAAGDGVHVRVQKHR